MSRKPGPDLSNPSFPHAYFRRRLLEWFRREHRDLPWRRTRDPYHIWVSEVMLQQTQVVTVLRYYPAFLQKFPTIQELARASPSSVLARWAGMGYYSRARNLHRAARIILNRYGGEFPQRYEDLRSLPGIGRYTAGAILSIAFGQRYPVVDGNVERVLARVMALRGDVKAAPYQKYLWSLAGQLTSRRSPSDFNQGMMELGALVCLPRQPQCGLCPVKSMCRARHLNLESRIPKPRRTKTAQYLHRLAAVVRDGRNRVLLVQRRDEELMRDFWEFPQFDVPARGDPGRDGRDSSAFLGRSLHKRFGREFTISHPLCRFQQNITFRRITVQAFEAQLNGEVGRLQCDRMPCRWITARALKDHLFDSTSLKILSNLQNR
ncbi:MAG: A/G-specific adenine glycosylase [Acidobacteriia bacterium]|nr:A/G-specific adenine glycosylase [Terriglobia bacterium]